MPSSLVPSAAGAASWEALLGNDEIRAMVGSEALARGMVYARSGHVMDVALDEESLTVTGRVRGTYRDAYEVTVYLARSRSGGTTVYRSQCTCPVALDCKHAAAVLIVARHTAAVRQRMDRPEWEKTLARLLSAPRTDPAAVALPLALEFEVERIPAFRGYAGRQDLRIRPARPGRGGWVRSGISWEDLDHVTSTYRPEHRELLLQFRAAAGAGARYALPRTPWLSIGTVTSAFWTLLEQAAALEVTLLTAKPLSGPVRSADAATVTLDARRAGAAGLLLRPRVTVGEHRLELPSVGVLGEPAHGIFTVVADPAGGEQLVVARLASMLSRELRQLVVEAHPLVVPAADEERFLADFLPELRHAVAVTSSDGSVALPRVVPPLLELTVGFAPGPLIDLTWAARYERDDGVRTFPLSAFAERAAGRDLPAEAALLSDLRWTELGWPQVNRPPQPAGLRGAAALTFLDEVVPRLEEAGVVVVLAGQVVDYRRTEAEPIVAVSAVERDGSADWFDLHVEVSVEGESVPFDQLFVALSGEDEFLVLETGVYFSLDRPDLRRLRDLIEESKSLTDSDVAAEELRINRTQVSLWEDLVELGEVIQSSARWTSAVRALTSGSGPEPGAEPVAVPARLVAELRPYQVEGYRWLHQLWSHGLGGILADDMGLGKTLQTLALVCRARVEEASGAFLVVAPTSVVSNWQRESATFAPTLRVVAVTESETRRARSGGPSIAEIAANADLVVTSYALLRIDDDAWAAETWGGLVLDEAQFVKNHRAKTYASARRVAAPFTLAVTGTPLENNLMDLWALLSLTAPGLFPDPDRFRDFYRRPIERGGDQAKLDQLRRRMRPLVLRRTKESVAPELPAKAEQVLDVVLQPRHLRIYQRHLQRERQKVLGLIADVDANRFTILASLTLLRQLSLDASLVDPAYAGVPSAKIELLVDQLTELVAEGHQALVFSQFTSFLGRVRERLDAAQIPYAYLDGSTRRRDQVIQRFRDGEAPVFLISLKAGGFGLNLTEADYCFLLDPWWNPAAEAQAVDRTHRIGQTKSVLVYRMVSVDTIEEKVMELKARKTELFDSVLGGDAMAGGALSADDIRVLLTG
ncbi:SNF2-related protein [uncultured Friedmanniella sp.]|uniref:DEAD/DEAH box helicase n=1 Tax=uncultured Friedmanniella sp. TaxID=335381 RepID=UPI0035CB398B